MAGDVKTTLIERIKNSRYYSIQLDETTDVADLGSIGKSVLDSAEATRSSSLNLRVAMD